MTSEAAFTPKEIQVLRIAMERYLNSLDLAKEVWDEDSDEFCDLELDMTRAEVILNKLDNL